VSAYLGYLCCLGGDVVTERFTCARGRDIGALIDALGRQGGKVTLTESDPSMDGSIVHVELPADEYREKRCRDLIDEWRGGHRLWT
jgi:hypothetical protein